MCSNTFILMLLFALKVLIFLIPLVIYILKRTNFIESFIKYFYIAEFVFVAILILLCFIGTDCIKNSSIKGIKLNSKMFDNINYLDEESTLINYEKIKPSKTYKNNIGFNVNYYNINLYPYSDIKIDCEKKSYFQNYGNDISALTTGISTAAGYEISPYDLLEYAEKNNLINCNTQVSSEDLMISLTNLYGVSVYSISNTELTSYLNMGKIVLAKTKVNNDLDNISCGEKLIVIYAFNSKGEFKILNPSDKTTDYFCPTNTSAYGTIVKGNQNSLTYDLNSLSNYLSDYYVFEVN